METPRSQVTDPMASSRPYKHKEESLIRQNHSRLEEQKHNKGLELTYVNVLNKQGNNQREEQRNSEMWQGFQAAARPTNWSRGGEELISTVAEVGQGPAARTPPQLLRRDIHGISRERVRTHVRTGAEGCRRSWERGMGAHERTEIARRCAAAPASCCARWKPPARQRRIQDRLSIAYRGATTLSIGLSLEYFPTQLFQEQVHGWLLGQAHPGPAFQRSR